VTESAAGGVSLHMARVFIISAALTLILSACGGAPDVGSRSGERAQLTVEHILDPNSPPLYIEGSVWHLRVLDSEGGAVVDRKLMDENAAVALEPGRYRLESEEFPCDGNCGRLGPGTDGCSKEFEAEPGATLAAVVTLRPTQGCAIEFAPEPAA